MRSGDDPQVAATFIDSTIVRGMVVGILSRRGSFWGISESLALDNSHPNRSRFATYS
jgi:hypothetical protein